MAVDKLINETQGNDIIDKLSDIASKVQGINYGMEVTSNDVVSMSGYQKASTASAISQADSLNEAVGKLEKGLDDKVPNSDLVAVEGMITDNTFSTSTSYAIGDIVSYQHTLYQFTSAHSAGAWSGSDVTAINVMDIIGDFNSALEAML